MGKITRWFVTDFAIKIADRFVAETDRIIGEDGEAYQTLIEIIRDELEKSPLEKP